MCPSRLFAKLVCVLVAYNSLYGFLSVSAVEVDTICRVDDVDVLDSRNYFFHVPNIPQPPFIQFSVIRFFHMTVFHMTGTNGAKV